MDELIRLHNRFTTLMEKRARKSFLDSVSRTLKRSDFAVAIDEIRSGKTPYVRGELIQRLTTINMDLTPLETVIRDSFIGGGRITAKAYGNKIAKANEVSLDFDFDVTLDDAIEWAARNAGNAVTAINQATHDALREMVMKALADGVPPWELSEQLVQVVGLSGRDAIAVEKYRDSMLQQYSRTQANKLTKVYANKLLSQRATVIARTEVLTASNAGQKEYWRQGVKQGLIDETMMVREWIATIPSERTCPICSELHGTHASIEGFFIVGSQNYEDPPAHPQCRCTTALVMADEEEIADIEEIAKINHNHDKLGRFATSSGGGSEGASSEGANAQAPHVIINDVDVSWDETPSAWLRKAGVKNIGGASDIEEYDTLKEAKDAVADWADYSVVSITNKNGDTAHFAARLNKQTIDRIASQNQAKDHSLAIAGARSERDRKSLQAISRAFPDAELSTLLSRASSDSLAALAASSTRMSELYPDAASFVRRVQYRGRQTGVFASVAWIGGSPRTTLSIDALGSMSEAQYQTRARNSNGWLRARTMEEVFNHEFGHIVQIREVGAQGMSSTFSARGTMGGSIGRIKPFEYTEAQRPATEISRYAGKNNFEAGAEIWGMMHEGHPPSSSRLPHRYRETGESMLQAARTNVGMPIEKSDDGLNGEEWRIETHPDGGKLFVNGKEILFDDYGNEIVSVISKYNKNHAKDGKFASGSGGGGGSEGASIPTPHDALKAAGLGNLGGPSDVHSYSSLADAKADVEGWADYKAVTIKTAEGNVHVAFRPNSATAKKLGRKSVIDARPAEEVVNISSVKRLGREFTVKDTSGKVVKLTARDDMDVIENTKANVRALKQSHGVVISPHSPDNPRSYQNVVLINKNPKGEPRAIAFDSKGRKQWRYSAEHRATKDGQKFTKIAELNTKVKKLDSAMRRDAKTNPTAAVALVMRKSALRIGSDKNTGAERKAYGASTLEARHVKIVGDTVHFAFDSKKGGHTRVSVKDPELAAVMKAHMTGKKGTDRIFPTVDETKTNAYIKQHLGTQYSNHNLRTLHATAHAASLLKKAGEPPKSEVARKKILDKITKQVADSLGDTPKVAHDSYIDPTVWQGWV